MGKEYGCKKCGHEMEMPFEALEKLTGMSDWRNRSPKTICPMCGGILEPEDSPEQLHDFRVNALFLWNNFKKRSVNLS